MQGSLVTFNGLLTGSKLFDIPVYQRSYAWEEDNLKDLWEDLYYLDRDKEHFFGTVLLKDSGKSTLVEFLPHTRYDVIDGQQRLTTSLILLKEILTQMKYVGDGSHKMRIENLERNFLKNDGCYKLNPQSGGRESKIDDRQFFHEFIIDGKKGPRAQAETPSQQRLLDASDFFKSKLEEEKEKLGDTGYLEFLTEFIGKINTLQIMQYTVDSDSDAIRMFETVNDRGRPLTNLEKTKSFLMHSVYLGADESTFDDDIGELNGRFANIYDYYEDVSKTSFSGAPEETAIQRYHFIYSQTYRGDLSIYLNRLKDEIRNILRKDPAAGRTFCLHYADELESAFLAFKQIAEALDNTDVRLADLIRKIYQVDRLANIYPLVLASWIKFQDNPKGLVRILKLIETFTFRVYVVVGYRSDSARTNLYQRAYHAHHGTWDCDRIIAEMEYLNRNYVSDGGFERSLRSDNFFNRLSSRHIRYLLSEYEIELNPDAGADWQSKILSPGYEVEHIWPGDTSKLGLFEEQEIEEHRQNLNKLGNLTVVSSDDNKWLSNNPFWEKKKIFGNLNYGQRPRIQTDLLKFPDRWGTESIKQREDQIVAFALKRWSVDDV